MKTVAQPDINRDRCSAARGSGALDANSVLDLQWSQVKPGWTAYATASPLKDNVVRKDIGDDNNRVFIENSQLLFTILDPIHIT